MTGSEEGFEFCTRQDHWLPTLCGNGRFLRDWVTADELFGPGKLKNSMEDGSISLDGPITDLS